MSLAIDVDLVERVLLADGWHFVVDGTFTIDSYEFEHWPPNADHHNDEPLMMHNEGKSGICASGFAFQTLDNENNFVIVAGPLTALLAVEMPPRTGDG